MLSAVTAWCFGWKVDGYPIRPSQDGIRAITEQQAEKIVGLVGLRQIERVLASPQCSDYARLAHDWNALQRSIHTELAKYGEDFGADATERLEAYCRRQAVLQTAGGIGRSH